MRHRAPASNHQLPGMLGASQIPDYSLRLETYGSTETCGNPLQFFIREATELHGYSRLFHGPQDHRHDGGLP